VTMDEDQQPLLSSPADSKFLKRRASTFIDKSPTVGRDTVFPQFTSVPTDNKRLRIDNTATGPLSAPATEQHASDRLHWESALEPASAPPNITRLVLLNPKKRSLPSSLDTIGTAATFSMLTALCSHTDILVNVIRFITPRNLVYLYSISAPFHYLMNSHFTQFILASSGGFAPRAEYYYPWRCYRELCIDDPALRRPSTQCRKGFVDRASGKRKVSDEWEDNTKTGKESCYGYVRAVPSLRWLKMVTYREIVSREIVAWLAVGGHRTPVQQTIDAVKKMWFLIDIPVSSARVALIHNSAYFTKQTLAALMMFFIKLDMFWTDPISYTGGERVLRQFLLAERTLTTLWNFLRGADGTQRLDALILWVKHGYKRRARWGPETAEEQKKNDYKDKQPIFGVPAKLVGRYGYECYGLGDKRLIRPDELVLREQLRRGMDLQRQWLRMIRWGFLDNKLETMPPVKAEDVVLSLIRRKKKKEHEEAQEEAKKAEPRPDDKMMLDQVGENDENDPLANLQQIEDELMQDT